MDEVSIVGVDLAKQVFQLHGANADGRVIFRKKLSRSQFARFMAGLPFCIVAMVACRTAHDWGREMASHCHGVRLLPRIYVKPLVKRQKNARADTEAIAEAALRPTMCTVPVKTAAQKSWAMLFRTREPMVGQRTQLVNALRGHLAEHRFIVAKAQGNIERLATVIRDQASALPERVQTWGRSIWARLNRHQGRLWLWNARILRPPGAVG